MKRLMVQALKNIFNMDKEDAIALTKTVEAVFKGRKEVEDMSIDKHVRSLFYELQREKLLKLRRDEYTEKGKTSQTRKYYWSFDQDAIREGAYRKTKEIPYQIYEKLPRNAWVVHTCNT